MGHSIQGFVGPYDGMLDWSRSREGFVVAPLAQKFGLMVERDPHYGVFSGPTESDCAWCEAHRAKTSLAFVATEYSGGPGEQGAAAWTTTETIAYAYGEFGYINRALQLIGVLRDNDLDEFDSIGLGWYRSNEDWMEFAKAGKASWERQAWPAAAMAFAAKHGKRSS